MPKSPDEMRAAIIRNLQDRTGRDLAAWSALVRADAPTDTRGRIGWLRERHGLGGVTAQVIVERVERPDGARGPTEPELINAQYAGARAALRPVLKRITAAALALGDDVEIGVRKTYVAFSRRRQFAVAKPTTRSRVDLGLALADMPYTGRLLPAKNLGGGDRNTHRVELLAPDEVDEQVLGWLRQAYANG